MKTLTKVMIILLIASCIFMCLPQNMVFADRNDVSAVVGNIGGDTNTASQFTGDLSETINKVIGFLQIASGFAAIIALVMLGFKYLTEGTADTKKDTIKAFWPILVGFILVFGAATIVKFIIGIT